LIQHDYWKSQYDKRFLRAPVDGVVTEVLADVGRKVDLGAHVFTVSNENVYSIPVVVPAMLAVGTAPSQSLPVRASDGKSVTKAMVDSVIDDPRGAGKKIIRLLVKAADFPATIRPKLMGMKFDVLLPELADGSTE
jgi:multidrug efflux pump subunit AcrA (membrane-fusion protein)